MFYFYVIIFICLFLFNMTLYVFNFINYRIHTHMSMPCCKISNIVSDPDQNYDVLHCVNVEAEIGKHFTTMGSATLVCGKYPDWPRSLRRIKAIDVTQAVAPRELLSGISLRIVPQGWISVRNKAMDWNESKREREGGEKEWSKEREKKRQKSYGATKEKRR